MDRLKFRPEHLGLLKQSIENGKAPAGVCEIIADFRGVAYNQVQVILDFDVATTDQQVAEWFVGELQATQEDPIIWIVEDYSQPLSREFKDRKETYIFNACGGWWFGTNNSLNGTIDYGPVAVKITRSTSPLAKSQKSA